MLSRRPRLASFISRDEAVLQLPVRVLIKNIPLQQSSYSLQLRRINYTESDGLLNLVEALKGEEKYTHLEMYFLNERKK